MSIELERLLGECADAGIVFYVRGGAVSLRMMKGQVSAGLLSRIGSAKNQIRVWLVSAFSVARCIDCPRGEHCAGIDCHVVSGDVEAGSDQKTDIGGTPV